MKLSPSERLEFMLKWMPKMPEILLAKIEAFADATEVFEKMKAPASSLHTPQPSAQDSPS